MSPSAHRDQKGPVAIVKDWLAECSGPATDVAGLLCDRHAPAAVAFTIIDADLVSRDLTYGELEDQSRRLATVLADLGVRQGDRVPVLMGKRWELPVTLLALSRLGAVHVPLFTAFAAGAVAMRVVDSRAHLVVTEPSQRQKLDGLDVHVLEAGDELERSIEAADALASNVTISGDEAFLHLFTSGTTGKPKAVAVPARALASFQAYMRFGLGVTPDDVFWNAADPGWAYGLYYGLVGPMVMGQRQLLLQSGFTPESTLAVMRAFEVTNFAGAPTMYRAMSKSGLDTDGIRLRRASSAGEPLTPDISTWAAAALGTEVRDHYGQTETGMTINNHWHDDVALPVREGSMGQPMPGYAATVVDGEICLEVEASPAMWFTGYHEAAEKSSERFTSDRRLYRTADTGKTDESGYFYFTARNDDVILAAGYRIGPFDVESVLITHPRVVDVGVVGRPDPEGIRGEIVEAFVVLGPGPAGDEALVAELQELVRDGYSKHAYPRRVHFVDALPKTPSGKVQRYLLRGSTPDQQTTG